LGAGTDAFGFALPSLSPAPWGRGGIGGEEHIHKNRYTAPIIISYL
jgi:hypothetical protein